MTSLITPIATFVVKLAVTVIWALILSKLIRGVWSLAAKHVIRRENEIVITH